MMSPSMFALIIQQQLVPRKPYLFSFLSYFQLILYFCITWQFSANSLQFYFGTFMWEKIGKDYAKTDFIFEFSTKKLILNIWLKYENLEFSLPRFLLLTRLYQYINIESLMTSFFQSYKCHTFPNFFSKNLFKRFTWIINKQGQERLYSLL